MIKEEIMNEMYENDILFRHGFYVLEKNDLINLCIRYEELEKMLEELNECSQK